MSFGSFDSGGGSLPMAEINTTPLVDVMLVLLVIFIITAPLFHQAAPVDLPRTEATKLDEKPHVLTVAIDGQNKVFINGESTAETELTDRFAATIANGSVPEMHLWADRATRYERVTEVMAKAQKAGIVKIAFVTESTQ